MSAHGSKILMLFKNGFQLSRFQSASRKSKCGSRARTLGLSLMNIGNMSANKVKKMICGLREEEIHPSERYLMKRQRKAVGELEPFINLS